MKGCQLSFEERLVPKLKPNASKQEKLEWMALVLKLEELPRNNAERVEQVREITKRK